MTASSEVPRHGSTSTIDTALVQVSRPSHHHILTPSLCTPHTMCRLYYRFIPHISHILTVTPSSSTSTHYMQNAGSINMNATLSLPLPTSAFTSSPLSPLPMHTPSLPSYRPSLSLVQGTHGGCMGVISRSQRLLRRWVTMETRDTGETLQSSGAKDLSLTMRVIIM